MSTPSGAPSHPAPPAGGQDGAAVDQRVAVITLGCARNEVDSEELAGRLAGEGWRLVPDPDDADVVLVNTCGFIEAAKKDSIDTVLELSGGAAKVVATGCLAERYGRQLADSLPEADAVFGFDEYPRIGAALAAVVAGERPPAHEPRDRRTLLPITPAARREASAAVAVPGHGPQIPRRRLADAVWAPLKLASGCDRRCAFCAIPSFRGAYVSRTPEEILAEARWLAEQGVRELFLVSENTTSYGKDLGDLRLLETLLPELARIDGIEWLRLSYLQPAELRPGMIEVLCDTDKVVPYFDLSFQHASEAVLRRMRRFGNPERFGQLLDRIRQMQPQAGIRTNVILGFPGETEDDVAVLERFLTDARLDVVGVFGYSDEEGTEATGFDDHVAQPLIAERVERVSSLVEELMTQRAEDRIHDRIDVIVEAVEQPGAGGPAVVVGRGAHQAPEVDGGTTMRRVPGARVGDVVRGRVVAVDGVDLIAEHVG